MFANAPRAGAEPTSPRAVSSQAQGRQNARASASASARSLTLARYARSRVFGFAETLASASAKAACVLTGTTCGAIAGAIAGYASARGVVRGAFTGAVAGASVLLETLGEDGRDVGSRELEYGGGRSTAEEVAVFTDRDGERRVLHLSFSHTMNVSQVLRMLVAREVSFEALTAENEERRRGAPRASDETIASLPTAVFGAEDAKTREDEKSKDGCERNPDALAALSCCAVCLEHYVAGDLVKRLPRCEHEFHATCLEKWLSRRGQCPLCRVPVL